MKMYLIILLAMSSRMACGQIPSPVPPSVGTWSDVRVAHINNKFRQNPPPPTGGFWVIEENARAKAPVIVRFYNNLFHELHADTLACQRLNPKSRPVVLRLNEQLSDWLAITSAAALASHRPTP